MSPPNPLPENAGDGSFLKLTLVEPNQGYYIQKWAVPTPTIYRKPEAKGWGETWDGRPVKLISEKP